MALLQLSEYLLGVILGVHREARLHEESGLVSRLNGVVFSFLFLFFGCFSPSTIAPPASLELSI